MSDTKKPIIDVTPESPDEGYRRYGEKVMLRAITLLRELAPDKAALFDAERAFLINIYGKRDLARLAEWWSKYSSGGNVIVWSEVWEHKEADRVVSALFLVPGDRKVADVMREKLGCGLA